jgi:hypothetical protein
MPTPIIQILMHPQGSGGFARSLFDHEVHLPFGSGPSGGRLRRFLLGFPGYSGGVGDDWAVHQCFINSFRLTGNRRSSGSGHPRGPGTHSKRWGAKPPIFGMGFQASRKARTSEDMDDFRYSKNHLLKTLVHPHLSGALSKALFDHEVAAVLGPGPSGGRPVIPARVSRVVRSWREGSIAEGNEAGIPSMEEMIREPPGVIPVFLVGFPGSSGGLGGMDLARAGDDRAAHQGFNAVDCQLQIVDCWGLAGRGGRGTHSGVGFWPPELPRPQQSPISG